MRQWHTIDAMLPWIKSKIKSPHIGSSVRIGFHVIRRKMKSIFIYTRKILLNNLQYILSCKSLETLRISNSYQLSAATVLKIPESLTSLKSLTFDEVFSVDTNTLQALFTGSNLRLNEFGLTERSNLESSSQLQLHSNNKCLNIYIEYSNSFSDENLTALANCMHTTLVSLKLKNCMNLRNVMPLFEHCKFLKYLDLTDCSCIKVPAWLVPVGPAIILPQSLSSIQLRDNLNFDSAITMDSHLFSYKTDKSIYNSEENIF